MRNIRQTIYFLLVTILISVLVSNATVYPSAPPVPNKFENAQEVQRYLNQLHNYYMVVGRPRFVMP